MKNKIIISINPTEFLHSVNVFENKESIYTAEFTANSFENVVMRTIAKYPEAKIYIQGPKDYTCKFGGLLLDTFQHTYTEKTLDIEYI